MAPRQRFIWPTIWDDPDLGTASEAALILYIACFSNADDEGRLLGNPAYLRSIAFRYRDGYSLDNITALRDELAATCGSFRVYNVDGTEYVAFANWDEFQRPKYPRASKLPPYPGYRRGGRKAASRQRKPSGTPTEPLVDDSANGYPMGRVGQGRVGLGTTGETSTADVGHAAATANGLPFAQELQISKLLQHIGKHADEGTPHVLRRYALHLPESALARVLESSETAKPRDRAAYVVAALKGELDALRPPQPPLDDEAET